MIFKGPVTRRCRGKGSVPSNDLTSNRLGVKIPSVITDVLYTDNTNYLDDNVDSKCSNFFDRRYRELAVKWFTTGTFRVCPLSRRNGVGWDPGTKADLWGASDSVPRKILH